MKRTFVTLSICLSLFLIGCASLNPGADPLVVRVEQGQAGANATFDFVLREDNANREFWKTNALAFHQFCEWLRTPQTYMGTTNMPRVVVMQLNVDDLKTAYKNSKNTGSSNALWSAFSVFSAALGQAASWQSIVTTTTHP